MEISTGLLIGGYIVSYVLAYIIIKTTYRMECGEECWTYGNRAIVLMVSLLGPISVAGGLLALGVIYLQTFCDKPAKW